MKPRIALALGVVSLIALGSVYAAQSTAEVLKAKIDFAFSVGNKVLPAGEYVFTKDEGAQAFRIQGAGNTRHMVNIITQLSGEVRANPKGAALVFDTVGDKYILSEIWIPGVEGFLVQVTKGAHTHKVVKIGG